MFVLAFKPFIPFKDENAKTPEKAHILIPGHAPLKDLKRSENVQDQNANAKTPNSGMYFFRE